MGPALRLLPVSRPARYSAQVRSGGLLRARVPRGTQATKGIRIQAAISASATVERVAETTRRLKKANFILRARCSEAAGGAAHMIERRQEETIDPPYLYPDYRSTVLRAPRRPLVQIPRDFHE